MCRYASTKSAKGIIYDTPTGKPGADRNLPFEPEHPPLPRETDYESPYIQYDKEAREWYTKGLIISKTDVHENRQRDPLRVDPSAEPFKEIYDQDTKTFTKVEVVDDPKMWYWVERLLPKQQSTIPVQFRDENKQELPSGLTLPSKQPPQKSYFVARTRTRLLPVYKLVEPDEFARPLIWGKRKPRDAPMLPIPYSRKDPISFKTLTVVGRIEGQARDLERDLRTFLEQKYQKKILTAVGEAKGQLKIKGNYVEDVAKWLSDQGF